MPSGCWPLAPCRYAHRAITADPSVVALLPCNVVVRSRGDRATLDAFDPGVMMRLAGGQGELDSLAAEVGEQLRGALSAVAGDAGELAVLSHAEPFRALAARAGKVRRGSARHPETYRQLPICFGLDDCVRTR